MLPCRSAPRCTRDRRSYRAGKSNRSAAVRTCCRSCRQSRCRKCRHRHRRRCHAYMDTPCRIGRQCSRHCNDMNRRPHTCHGRRGRAARHPRLWRRLGVRNRPSTHRRPLLRSWRPCRRRFPPCRHELRRRSAPKPRGRSHRRLSFPHYRRIHNRTARVPAQPTIRVQVEIPWTYNLRMAQSRHSDYMQRTPKARFESSITRNREETHFEIRSRLRHVIRFRTRRPCTRT